MYVKEDTVKIISYKILRIMIKFSKNFSYQDWVPIVLLIPGFLWALSQEGGGGGSAEVLNG